MGRRQKRARRRAWQLEMRAQADRLFAIYGFV